jgi:hypothetical protein
MEAPEMAKLLRIGDDTMSVPLISMPKPKALDVPLADYEADLLLKVGKK